ncbi:TPA: hypothetical protein AABK73_09565 [Neisseria gonorrhoeae]
MLMKFHVICLNNIFNDIFNTDCFFLINICLLLYCTREDRLKTSYLIFRRPFAFSNSNQSNGFIASSRWSRL